MKCEPVKPAGLGARDVLRLEMGYSLYGHELNEDISPLESGLNRFIDFNKEFIGKDALLKQKETGLKRKVVGICSDTKRSPREGHAIFLPSGENIGSVTSGTFSPSLNKGIGLGFIDAQMATMGMAIEFGKENTKNTGVISTKNFYKSGSLKA
jgi:aminomethyltransferase